MTGWRRAPSKGQRRKLIDGHVDDEYADEIANSGIKNKAPAIARRSFEVSNNIVW